MQFKKKSPKQEYTPTYTFGLTDDQLHLAALSKDLRQSQREPLTIQEMALLYQLEPSELVRFREFAKNSTLSTDQLIDLVNPNEPLAFAPPVEDLKFAMLLSTLDQLQARKAIFDHMGTRPGVRKGGFTFANTNKQREGD
jgi:hypothetical protein